MNVFSMITNQKWKKLSKKKQDELSEEAFSYRQCQKCLNHFHLGEQDEDSAQAMYLDSYDFDCSDKAINKYEKQNDISLSDNVFCFKCVKLIDEKLRGTI